jgi:hypothetical protein
MTAPPVPDASGVPVHCAHHALAPLSELRPHPANPNTHPERQVAIYAEAIRRHGWREAITVSKRSGFVISGHGAIEAARRLALANLPVEYQDYGSDEEELADLLAHNRLAELAVTDKRLLRAALEKLGAGDFVSGYSEADIARIVEQSAPAPQYPITPMLNEAHNFLVIYCDSETDWQFLKNVAGVRFERSYKNQTVGEGRVRRFGDFLASLRENLHSIAPAGVQYDDAPASQ